MLPLTKKSNKKFAFEAYVNCSDNEQLKIFIKKLPNEKL
jgi:hypothetical protein